MTATAPEENGEMANDNTEVLVALSRMEGQLSSFIGTMDRHGADLQSVKTDLSSESEARRTETGALDRRVTTIEATTRAKPGSMAVIGTLASLLSVLAVVGLLLDRLYG